MIGVNSFWPMQLRRIAKEVLEFSLSDLKSLRFSLLAFVSYETKLSLCEVAEPNSIISFTTSFIYINKTESS